MITATPEPRKRSSRAQAKIDKLAQEADRRLNEFIVATIKAHLTENGIVRGTEVHWVNAVGWNCGKFRRVLRSKPGFVEVYERPWGVRSIPATDLATEFLGKRLFVIKKRERRDGSRRKPKPR